MSWSIPPAKKVVIFGRPGSGKSSLAGQLGAEHGFVAIRTGELLREAVRRGDELGVRVARILKAGKCVPDPLIERSLEDACLYPTVCTVDPEANDIRTGHKSIGTKDLQNTALPLLQPPDR